MVKTYEEEQADGMSEKNRNTLFAIISRYISDEYRQFEWNISPLSPIWIDGVKTDILQIKKIINHHYADLEIEIYIKENESPITCTFVHSCLKINKSQTFPKRGNMTP